MFPVPASQVMTQVHKLFGREFSNHSFRRGAIRHLEYNGASTDEILAVSRHRSKKALIHYLQGPLPETTKDALSAQGILNLSPATSGPP